MEKYPNCANLSIPNEDNPEKKAYESFVVPSGDLEAYKSLPKVSFIMIIFYIEFLRRKVDFVVCVFCTSEK